MLTTNHISSFINFQNCKILIIILESEGDYEIISLISALAHDGRANESEKSSREDSTVTIRVSSGLGHSHQFHILIFDFVINQD